MQGPDDVMDGLPDQWAPVQMAADGSHALVHVLPDGTEVGLHENAALLPYGTGWDHEPPSPSSEDSAQPHAAA